MRFLGPANAAPWPDRPLLIVDDDALWITVLTQALRVLGWHRVQAATDPTLAAGRAEELEPAVVILDLLMTQRPGLEVLSDLRRAQPDCSIVVVTSVDQVEQAVACMHAGATDYLTKPLSRSRLEEALVRATWRPETVIGGSRADFRSALHDLGELPKIKQVPEMLIEEALRRSSGVVKDAASMLGISAQAICNRRRRRRGMQRGHEESRH